MEMSASGQVPRFPRGDTGYVRTMDTGANPAWSVDPERTRQGRDDDVTRAREGARVAPVAGALAGIAALGTISRVVRRRRASAQAGTRTQRRRWAGAAVGVGALSAVLGTVRGRSAQRGP